MDELKSANTNQDVQEHIAELPTVRGDRALIRQVFVNLLSNALKFTSTRDAAVIEIGHMVANGEDVYYVKDNGVGFEMQYADKLFGVFQRLHTPDEFEGFKRLGLAKGFLRVASSPLTRSSYHAGKDFEALQKARRSA
ncbi:MAG: hypothetical protein IH926_13435 [Proteobacteria bacterium]|nr:hypothetical protein [Pseudomonadota bacterium]